MDVSRFSEKLKNAGVVGAGGAGFPAYAKLADGIDTVILNCAECEPLLRVHRQLLATKTIEVLKGLDMLRKATGAKKAIVALKAEYKEAAKAVGAYLNEFENITVSHLPEIYPAGDEIVLIYETTKRIVKAGTLPSSVGVCVFNVETAYNAYMANEGKSVIHKYVTITGEVKKPCTLRLPIGISFDDAVALAGGKTNENTVYISGGPMTGRIVNGAESVSKTTNAILVVPYDHYIVNKRKTKLSISVNRAMSVCCQCRMCTDMCPRNLLGHPIEPHKFMRALAASDGKQVEAVLNTAFCSGCGVCEMYACPQGLSARTLIGACKNELRKEGIKAPEAKMSEIEDRREYALLPLKRLIARLDLSRYDTDAPLDEGITEVKRVKIMLSQHIGAVPECMVNLGERVKAGQCIAKVGGSKLGADIHSSIDGIVRHIGESYIIIEK